VSLNEDNISVIGLFGQYLSTCSTFHSMIKVYQLSHNDMSCCLNVSLNDIGGEVDSQPFYFVTVNIAENGCFGQYLALCSDFHSMIKVQ
jgi:hypothetical protein